MPKVKKPAPPTSTGALDETADRIKGDVLTWVRLFQDATGRRLGPEDEQALVAFGVRNSPADRETLLRLLRK